MIEIEGRWFRPGGLQHLSLQDLIDFDVWLAQHNRGVSHWWELPELADEIKALPERFQLTHPEIDLLRAVRVWASLRRAGRVLSFDEALDVDATTIREVGRDDDSEPEPENLPRGFVAGNTQSAASIDPDGMDLEEEVHSRILAVFRAFPGLTWRGVWDLPLFVWLGVAAQIDELRAR